MAEHPATVAKTGVWGLSASDADMVGSSAHSILRARYCRQKLCRASSRLRGATLKVCGMASLLNMVCTGPCSVIGHQGIVMHWLSFGKAWMMGPLSH